MENKIHDKCKKRLEDEFIKNIVDIEANNYILNLRTYMQIASDNKLKDILDSKSREELSKYIDEDYLNLFLYDSLASEILENPDLTMINDSNTTYKVFDHIDINKVANKIISSLDNIPLNIDFVFNLGKDIFNEPIKEKGIQISEELLLIKDIDWLEDTFKLQHPNIKRNDLIKKSYNKLTIPMQFNWENGNVYLLIRTYGYTSNTRKTNTTFFIENKFKSFLGLFIANNALTFDYYPKNILNDNYYVFNDCTIFSKERLNEDFSKGIRKINISMGLAEAMTGMKNTEKIKNTLPLLKKLFANNIEVGKIRNACCWLFDSYCGDNELLSFVQATIAIEILLGDKSESEKIGLGTLLKNRCAYLLGTTNEERNSILIQFEKIYTIRSKIVHRGHPKLNKEERGLLNEVRELAKQVIIKELELLKSY